MLGKISIYIDKGTAFSFSHAHHISTKKGHTHLLDESVHLPIFLILGSSLYDACTNVNGNTKTLQTWVKGKHESGPFI